MKKVNAKIILNKTGRTQAISTGYRPLFDFNLNTMISGHIELINCVQLNPGDQTEVQITFISEEVLSAKITPQMSFSFFEGDIKVGEGEILKIHF